MVRGEARPFKRRIEEHFDAIKSLTEGASAPELTPAHREWLKGLTADLRVLVTAFPPGISGQLAAMQKALSAAVQ